MFGSDKVENFLEEYKSIYDKYINFIESEENIEENFMNLTQIIVDAKIKDCQHKLRLFLRMVISIADNHQHCQQFYAKIDQTLEYFKDDIKKYFLNSEIFSIFKSNKRILLFLIEEKIISVDKFFINYIRTHPTYEQYLQYFAPEIKPFENEKWFPSYFLSSVEKLPDNFNALRMEGENHNYICKLIREDSVKDFIVHINKNNISLNSKIDYSIYETNSFLNNVQLIEYAAFFGSIQIFNFLKKEGVKLDSSLWYYVIHSKNAELIHLLEDNKLINKELYLTCFEESIKYHHNDVANYFLSNYIQNDDFCKYCTFLYSVEYYNFSFLENEYINKSSFYLLCKYDYYSFVEVLLACQNININQKAIDVNEIQNHVFQWNSKSCFSMKFKIMFFNEIQNHVFQWNSKSCFSMEFKIMFFNKIKIMFFNGIQNYRIQ